MNITFEILLSIAAIDEFKGEWRLLGRLSPEKLADLKKNSQVENIAASMRFNGDQLSSHEVDSILSRAVDSENNYNKKFVSKSRYEQCVLGYDHVQKKIIEDFARIPISHTALKELHAELLQYALKDQWHRGEYKKLWHTAAASSFDEHEIKKQDKFDLEKSSYESDGYAEDSASPAEAPKKMDELIDWINEQLNEKKIHPLILISMFIAIFMTIRPFQNNNGRMAKILISLFLLKAGYFYVPYHSLEYVIEKHKEQYYDILSQTQKSLNANNPDFEPWVSLLLRIIHAHKEELKVGIQQEKDLTFHVPELTAELIELINMHGRLTIKNAEKMTSANRNTIKKHIAIMVENGQILQLGKGKGTWYIAK